MKAPRIVAYGVLVLAGGLAAVAPAVTAAPATRSASSLLHLQGAGLNAGYPRLANYNGFRRAWQVPFFAAYDLIVARRNAPIALLKAANPHVVALLYERALQVDPRRTAALYGINTADVPGDWWLTGPASTLPLTIGPDQDWIPVASTVPFAPCQDILVDNESIHVLGIEGNWLHVQRGYFSHTAWHRQGARLAPHVSYRMDISNCQATDARPSLRPWSFNLSSQCPRWHGQTWIDFLAHRIAYLVHSQGWSGVFYDNLTDFPFSASVDTNDDGRADGGVVGGVNVWRQGEQQLLMETRRLLPAHPLLVNGDLRTAGLADGREMEGFPLIPGLALAAGIDSYLADGAAGAHMTIVNPDNVDRPYPAPDAAQLAVGIALLGDGYAAYDQGWLKHGASWWFDAEDGGAGTALQHAVSAWTAQAVVAHPWRFQAGDVVLMDAEAAIVVRVTPHSLVLERGMYGTSAAPHIAGATLTTVWQRMTGHGYLGLPLAPARAVPTRAWPANGLPLTLLNGSATGQTPSSPAQPIDGDGSLRFVSSVHYNADATGFTLYAPDTHHDLRTLVFSAYGPAGQTLQVADGHAGAEITLWPDWHQYVLPISGDGHISIGTGRVSGAVALRGVRVLPAQDYVLQRDFTHGTVIVNPTDLRQYVKLTQPYRLLAGDGDPRANSGALTCGVSVDAYTAAILLDVSGARCPVVAAHVARGTSRHSASRRSGKQ